MGANPYLARRRRKYRRRKAIKRFLLHVASITLGAIAAYLLAFLIGVL